MQRDESRLYFHLICKEAPLSVPTKSSIEQKVLALQGDIRMENDSLADLGILYASAEKEAYKMHFVKPQDRVGFDHRYNSAPSTLAEYFLNAEIPPALHTEVEKIELEGMMSISKKTP